MKKTKKLTSLLLVCIMVMSLNIPALGYDSEHSIVGEKQALNNAATQYSSKSYEYDTIAAMRRTPQEELSELGVSEREYDLIQSTAMEDELLYRKGLSNKTTKRTL